MKSVQAPKAAIDPTQPAVGIFCRVNGVLGLIARRWTRLSVIATALRPSRHVNAVSRVHVASLRRGVSARIGNSKARQFGTNAQVLELSGESYRLKQSKARRRRDPRPADEVAAAVDSKTGEIIRAS
jgi:hypothetical protein